MFVTRERLAYNDGDLVLRVPRLNLETRVVGGFSPEVREKLRDGTMTRQERIDFFGNSEGDLLLKSGVVLLNSASLPDPVIPNPNVSISGHRDIEGCEFYDIHKLTAGDRIYLTYAGREYVYEWQSTTIHKANDWSVTYSGTESIVSLISCDPIGTNRNRIVAVGKLIGYNDLTPSSSAALFPAAAHSRRLLPAESARYLRLPEFLPGPPQRWRNHPAFPLRKRGPTQCRPPQPERPNRNRPPRRLRPRSSPPGPPL